LLLDIWLNINSISALISDSKLTHADGQPCGAPVHINQKIPQFCKGTRMMFKDKLWGQKCRVLEGHAKPV
jgi:hypothetical protein